MQWTTVTSLKKLKIKYYYATLFSTIKKLIKGIKYKLWLFFMFTVCLTKFTLITDYKLGTV